MLPDRASRYCVICGILYHKNGAAIFEIAKRARDCVGGCENALFTTFLPAWYNVVMRCNHGCYSRDEFDDDDEAFDEFDEFSGEEEYTIPCPYCSVEIYEDTEMCPHCGSYILDEDIPSSRSWVFWTALILLALIFAGFTCLL